MKNKIAACKGGEIADDARINLELETRKKVASFENYLAEPESKKG